MTEDKWKFVNEYHIEKYKCGLKAGDRVRLKHDIVITDHKGNPPSKVYPRGEIWNVLTGAKEEPIVVWFRQADGERHTWDDDESIYETFEII
jgi:hypothetical protein